MLKFTIQVALTDAETDEHYTTFKQEVFDSFNADEFENVVEMFNELLAYVKKHYDCEDTYELSAYILDSEGNYIY